MWLIILFVVFVAAATKTTTLSDKERYEHMQNYLSKFGTVKEARPMVNKIRNSEDYLKLHKEFGGMKKLGEKKK